MKRIILIIISILLMTTFVFSQTIHKQAVNMKWDQVIYQTLQGWKFHVSKTSGTGFVEVYTKSYLPSEGIVGTPDPLYPELEKKAFVQAIDIPDGFVIKGQLQRIYFKAKSIRTDGQESEWSNEGYIDLDLRPIPAPQIKCETVK